jgi:hypothetical protein
MRTRLWLYIEFIAGSFSSETTAALEHFFLNGFREEFNSKGMTQVIPCKDQTVTI